MSRGALAIAWVSSVAVHVMAALLVIHAMPARTPPPPVTLTELEALGPGTGHGGGMAGGPAAAPQATAPPEEAPPPPPPPPVAPGEAPRVPAPPKPRVAARPAARPTPPRETAKATGPVADGTATTPGAGTAPGDGSGPGAGGGSPTGSPLGTAAVPPAVLTRVPPTYPHGARESGVEGAVVLLAIIAEDGRVEEPVRVAQSIPALDQAAIAALQRWHFRPGRDASGKPVRTTVEIPIRFQLR